MRSIITLAFALFAANLVAQSPFLMRGAQAELPLNADVDLYISDYQGLVVDLTDLRSVLAAAPLEFSNGRSAPVQVSLPTPEGQLATFEIVESPVMAPALQAKYPNIRSYRVTGPYGTGRMSVSDRGVVAMLQSVDGDYFITQAADDNNVDHLAYYLESMDYQVALGERALSCGFDPAQLEEDHDQEETTTNPTESQGGRSSGSMLGMRVYDLALTCTGEFASLRGGGTLQGVNAVYNEALSVLNVVYERDLAVRMQLIPNNDTLIFFDGGIDPFLNPTEGSGLLSQVEPAITGQGVTPNQYDLGHIFTIGCSDVGGVVNGRACTPGKARGVTCHSSNNVASITNRIMTHEVGHQFSAGHSWNFCPPSEDQRASSSAFEPGSGTTIMSYAGTCGNQNISGNNANYFHVGSLDQFIEWSREITPECPTLLEALNTEPVITIEEEDGFSIPISTPFILRGSATDADGDNLTYAWEQYDLGPARAIGDPVGNTPLFRVYSPTAVSNVRTVPRINTIVNNITDIRELLPTYGRDMTFRLVVRDNNANAGSAVWETLAFEVEGEAGPFLVMSPNDGTENWEAGQIYDVTWDVANTNLAPVNCQRVNVNLSLDGGFTYPISLAENVLNSGQVEVLIPADVVDNNARIQIEAADNIFFDISNEDFTIAAPTQAGYALSVTPAFQAICLPDLAVIDLGSTSVLGFDGDVSLEVISALPAGVSATFSNPTFAPGGGSQLELDFTGSGFSGPLEVQIQGSADGAATTVRTINVEVVNNDFSDLALTAPVEGSGSIILSTDFDWTDAQFANTYEIEIATDPSFSEGSILERGTGLSVSEYTNSTFFEPSLIYFWRIRPINACGPAPWAETNSFQTAVTDCQEYSSTDTPIGLQGNGPAFIATSEIFVDRVGVISDVNIPNIDINYQVVARVTLTLISPDGIRVELYGEDCPNFSGIFNSGFDDDAPNDITCPPDDGIVFEPVEALSAFEGEDTFGNWTLEVSISETGGAVGAIAGWTIEFCSASAPSSPELITLETLECPPTAANSIGTSVLEATDADFGSSDLTFSLIRQPRFGFIHRVDDMTPMTAGATFTQADLNGDQIVYRNTDGNATTDSWRFIVSNPNNGYIPVTEQPISIFEGATTGTPSIIDELEMELFPNPVKDQLDIRWAQPLDSDLPLVLYDVNGRELLRQQLQANQTEAQVQMSNLPAGMYWLRIAQSAIPVMKQ